MNLKADYIDPAIEELASERKKAMPKVSGNITKDYSWIVAAVAAVALATVGAALGASVGIAALGSAINGAPVIGTAMGLLGAVGGKLGGQYLKERTSLELQQRMKAWLETSALPAGAATILGLPEPKPSPDK